MLFKLLDVAEKVTATFSAEKKRRASMVNEQFANTQIGDYYALKVFSQIGIDRCLSDIVVGKVVRIDWAKPSHLTAGLVMTSVTEPSGFEFCWYKTYNEYQGNYKYEIFSHKNPELNDRIRIGTGSDGIPTLEKLDRVGLKEALEASIKLAKEKEEEGKRRSAEEAERQKALAARAAANAAVTDQEIANLMKQVKR